MDTLRENIIGLIHCLGRFLPYKSSIDDVEDFLTFNGINYSTFIDDANGLFRLSQKYGFEDALAIRIDGEEVSSDDLHIFSESYNILSNWQIQFNKSSLLREGEDRSYLFFLSVDSFNLWNKTINPFNEEFIINQTHSLTIIVNELKIFFAGERLEVLPAKRDFSYEKVDSNLNIPSNEKIKEQVHFISSEKIDLAPEKYIIIYGDLKNEQALFFMKTSWMVLSSCIVNEFYSKDKVVVKGYKRIELSLMNDADIVSDYSIGDKLISLIQWVYEERPETRMKLFNDRLSLDMKQEDSLILNLVKFISDSFKQAKEQYGFVILERKDAYIKEFRSLLIEVQKLSELYAAKVRLLLSNLMRDVLTALVLVAFTILPKISDKTLDLNNDLVVILFKIIAWYFGVSIILQLLVNCRDMYSSNKEIFYWLEATRNYMSRDEIQKHITIPLKSRKFDYYLFNGIISLIYFAVAVFFYFGPKIVIGYIESTSLVK